MQHHPHTPETQSARQSSVEPPALGATALLSSRPLDLERTRRNLVDPRTISRLTDPIGRAGLVPIVLEARQTTHTIREGINEANTTHTQILDTLGATQSQLYDTETMLSQRQGTRLARLKRTLGLRDRKTDRLQDQASTLEADHATQFNALNDIEKKQKELTKRQAATATPRQVLDDYYKQAGFTPLSIEQKQDLLKPEVLDGLTTEEYVALWRRLNPHFLSHVTRQGFRDHVGMAFHSVGKEDFHEGFVKILEDSRTLRSPIAIPRHDRPGLLRRDDETVRSWLAPSSIFKIQDETTAKELLEKLLTHTAASAPYYPDKTAIHFAAQEVADGYYGSESDNEIFTVFPVDVIASQHAYAFNSRGSFDNPASRGSAEWNDIFVWPETTDQPGIPIDSGLVFLPEHTPVDPETGSKYASEIAVIDGAEKRVMIENTELIDSFVNRVDELDAELFTDPTSSRAMQEIGVQLQDLGLDTDKIQGIAAALLYQPRDKENLRQLLRANSQNWLKAQNAIPAKVYWEKFFELHPDLRPKHLVYYNGKPTDAVRQFQEVNNIGHANTSKTDGPFLGFDDNLVTDKATDPRANRGLDDLRATAIRLIEQHFKSL